MRRVAFALLCAAAALGCVDGKTPDCSTPATGCFPESDDATAPDASDGATDASKSDGPTTTTDAAPDANTTD